MEYVKNDEQEKNSNLSQNIVNVVCHFSFYKFCYLLMYPLYLCIRGLHVNIDKKYKTGV